MKKNLIIIIALFIGNLQLSAQEKFSAPNADGVTLYYEIIDTLHQAARICKSPLNDAYQGIINIPASVTYQKQTYKITDIGFAAFNDCTSLKIVNLPNTISSIHSFAFAGCKSLISIALGDSITSIGSFAFSNCSSLISITLPQPLTDIGGNAFKGCTSLNSITLLSSTDAYVLRKKTFEDCPHIKNLTIGEKVVSIADEAFATCSEITNIKILTTQPPIISTNTFTQVPKNIPIYVPCEAIKVYQNNVMWSIFTNIQCTESNPNPIQ